MNLWSKYVYRNLSLSFGSVLSCIDIILRQHLFICNQYDHNLHHSNLAKSNRKWLFMNTFSKNQVWLFHINEIMQNVIFGNQNLSLHMFSRFICGLAYVSTSLIFVTKSYSILWMYITFYLSIHQLMEIWAVFSFEQCYCK